MCNVEQRLIASPNRERMHRIGRRSRTWFSGNPGSPGIEKLVSSAIFWTSFCASLHFYMRNQPLPACLCRLAWSVCACMLIVILDFTALTASSRHDVESSHVPPCLSSILSPKIWTDSPRAHPRPNLPQTLANPQNPIHQQPIRRPLNLKVPEKRVRAEQAQHLVQRVVALAVGLGALGRRQRGRRQCVGRAARARAQRQEREVADQPKVGLGVEDGVVGLVGGGGLVGSAWPWRSAIERERAWRRWRRMNVWKGGGKGEGRRRIENGQLTGILLCWDAMRLGWLEIGHGVGDGRQQGGVRWPSSSSVVVAPPAVYPIDARFVASMTTIDRMLTQPHVSLWIGDERR